MALVIILIKAFIPRTYYYIICMQQPAIIESYSSLATASLRIIFISCPFGLLLACFWLLQTMEIVVCVVTSPTVSS